MPTVLERVATVTAKGQTTVPKPVRDALGIDNGDQIAFRVDDQGFVSLVRVDEEADPVLNSFLSFLANDMKKRPGEAIKAMSPTLVHRIAELVEGVEFDLEEELEGDTAI